MKIGSAFCDLHPTYRLSGAEITWISPMTDQNKENSLRCTNPTRNRHFTRELGYIELVDGQRSNLGDVAKKPGVE